MAARSVHRLMIRVVTTRPYTRNELNLAIKQHWQKGEFARVEVEDVRVRKIRAYVVLPRITPRRKKR